MMVVATLAAAIEGFSPAYPLELMGGSFFGLAIQGAAAQAASGTLIHVFAAAVIGVMGAALIPRAYPLACTMTIGAGIALFSMGVMASLVVPLVNPGLWAGLQPIGGAWVLAHVVYGAVVGLAPAVRRRILPEPRALSEDRPARPSASPAVSRSA